MQVHYAGDTKQNWKTGAFRPRVLDERLQRAYELRSGVDGAGARRRLEAFIREHVTFLNRLTFARDERVHAYGSSDGSSTAVCAG